jgi:hypothetical protein
MVLPSSVAAAELRPLTFYIANIVDEQQQAELAFAYSLVSKSPCLILDKPGHGELGRSWSEDSVKCRAIFKMRVLQGMCPACGDCFKGRNMVRDLQSHLDIHSSMKKKQSRNACVVFPEEVAIKV